MQVLLPAFQGNTFSQADIHIVGGGFQLYLFPACSSSNDDFVYFLVSSNSRSSI